MRDKEHVLREGLWSFDKHLLLMKDFDGDYLVTENVIYGQFLNKLGRRRSFPMENGCTRGGTRRSWERRDQKKTEDRNHSLTSSNMEGIREGQSSAENMVDPENKDRENYTWDMPEGVEKNRRGKMLEKEEGERFETRRQLQKSNYHDWEQGWYRTTSYGKNRENGKLENG